MRTPGPRVEKKPTRGPFLAPRLHRPTESPPALPPPPALRRGGNLQRQPLEGREIEAPEPSGDILAVHEALERFQGVEATAAQAVKLRYFAGLTIPQAAEALGISTSTANRPWAYARVWLHTALKRDADDRAAE